MASKFPGNSGGNGAKNGSHFRKLSDNIELPKTYPDPTSNGEVRSRTDTLASVQNLPAVLTDPRKGKSQPNLNQLEPNSNQILQEGKLNFEVSKCIYISKIVKPRSKRYDYKVLQCSKSQKNIQNCQYSNFLQNLRCQNVNINEF